MNRFIHKISCLKEKANWKDRWNERLCERRKGMWSRSITKDRQVVERVGN